MLLWLYGGGETNQDWIWLSWEQVYAANFLKQNMIAAWCSILGSCCKWLLGSKQGVTACTEFSGLTALEQNRRHLRWRVVSQPSFQYPGIQHVERVLWDTSSPPSSGPRAAWEYWLLRALSGVPLWELLREFHRRKRPCPEFCSFSSSNPPPMTAHFWSLTSLP